MTGLLRPLGTAPREEGLEVSEAGFRDDRLWAPIFLPGLRWLLQLSQLRCWLLPTAFLGDSSRAYSPPPSFRAPSCGKASASDLGTNPTSVLNWRFQPGPLTLLGLHFLTCQWGRSVLALQDELRECLTTSSQGPE